MPEFEAYHGSTSQHHQSRFNALAPNGWRMISLSVHGSSRVPRYSVVWVKERSPAFVAVHDLPIGRYQQWFNDQTAQGFAPVLVSATGSGSEAVVAAVFEKSVRRGWIAKHGLTSGSDQNQGNIEFWNKRARESGLVLRSGSIYGTASQRQYIAVWHPEPEAYWNWRTAETPAGYQTWFNAFQEVPLRPGFVTISEQQEYLAAFRNDSVGPWVARHGLTADAYQGEFDRRKAEGLYPICVQGGGQGSNTRYAAIFAKAHKPKPRKWTVNGSGLGALDAAVKEFMQANGVRAGQLSVAKGGSMKAQRAYTWADEDYPVTQTGTLLRMASLSKMFTNACIQNLYDSGKLTETTGAFARAGITGKALASQSVDTRINDITVEHLVNNQGGWDSSMAGDWVFKMRQIARDLGLSGPASKLDLVRFIFGEPLQFDPGAKSQYSNIGYTTLAYLVERASGQSYEAFLRNAVLGPDGINDVRLARTLRSQRLPNEGLYDDPGVWWSAAEPTKDKLTAFCHGGEGWTTEAMDGSGGLCATSGALVQFIRRHAVWGRGGRMAGFARTGSMAGVSSRAQSRSDDVDFAFIFNSRHLNGMPVDGLASKLNALLDSMSI